MRFTGPTASLTALSQDAQVSQTPSLLLLRHAQLCVSSSCFLDCLPLVFVRLAKMEGHLWGDLFCLLSEVLTPCLVHSVHHLHYTHS